MPCEGEKARGDEHHGRCERGTEHGCELARCPLSFETSSRYHLTTELARRSNGYVNFESFFDYVLL